MTTQLDIFSTEPKPKPVKVSRILSAKQRAIVECLKTKGKQPLPKEIFNSKCDFLEAITPLSFRSPIVYWRWSWELCQEIKSADYRRRVHELREKGYQIESFNVGKRHGYVLLREPE